MNSRAELLEWKRRQLIAESEAQRIELASQMQSWGHTLESARIGLRIIDRLRRHRMWIAALTLGLAAIRPPRLSSLLRLGTSGLRTWRVVGPALRMLTNPK